MKSLLIFTSFLLTSVAIAKPINTGWFSSTAIKGYDSVSYFKQKKAVKGSVKATPTKYAPQYGGYCAYAMKDGKKVSIDPESFDIKNGKLYLNYSKSVQKKWKAEAPSFIEKADTAWDKL